MYVYGRTDGFLLLWIRVSSFDHDEIQVMYGVFLACITKRHFWSIHGAIHLARALAYGLYWSPLSPPRCPVCFMPSLLHSSLGHRTSRELIAERLRIISLEASTYPKLKGRQAGIVNHNNSGAANSTEGCVRHGPQQIQAREQELLVRPP